MGFHNTSQTIKGPSVIKSRMPKSVAGSVKATGSVTPLEQIVLQHANPDIPHIESVLKDARFKRQHPCNEDAIYNPAYIKKTSEGGDEVTVSRLQLTLPRSRVLVVKDVNDSESIVTLSANKRQASQMLHMEKCLLDQMEQSKYVEEPRRLGFGSGVVTDIRHGLCINYHVYFGKSSEMSKRIVALEELRPDDRVNVVFQLIGPMTTRGATYFAWKLTDFECMEAVAQSAGRMQDSADQGGFLSDDNSFDNEDEIDAEDSEQNHEDDDVSEDSGEDEEIVQPTWEEYDVLRKEATSKLSMITEELAAQIEYVESIVQRLSNNDKQDIDALEDAETLLAEAADDENEDEDENENEDEGGDEEDEVK